MPMEAISDVIPRQTTTSIATASSTLTASPSLRLQKYAISIRTSGPN